MIIANDYYDQITLKTKLFKLKTIEINKSLLANFELYKGLPCLKSISVSLNSSSFSFPVSQLIELTLNSSEFLVNSENLVSPLSSVRNLSFKFSLRNCDIGEFLDTKSMSCKPCQINFFSFETNISKASTCLSCFNREFYCYGGNNLSPRKGYWRLNESVLTFFKCPNNEGEVFLRS